MTRGGIAVFGVWGRVTRAGIAVFGGGRDGWGGEGYSCMYARPREVCRPVRSRRAGAAVSQVVRAVVFGGFLVPAPLSPPQLGLSHAQQLR